MNRTKQPESLSPAELEAQATYDKIHSTASELWADAQVNTFSQGLTGVPKDEINSAALRFAVNGTEVDEKVSLLALRQIAVHGAVGNVAFDLVNATKNANDLLADMRASQL